MDDESLIDVVKEIQRLRGEISDKQWKDQETTLEDRRLRYFEKLARQGEHYEPKF
jgi:hypothetical protein